MAYRPLRITGRAMRPPRVAETLERLIRWQLPTNGENGAEHGADEQPLRAELFSVEQLERHAKTVAESHQLAKGRTRDRLIARLDDNERMVAVVEQNPTDLILVLADMARANPPLTSSFLAELTRHLHGQSPHFAFAQSWLEHRLSEQGLRLAPLVQMESQVQAIDQVSI